MDLRGISGHNFCSKKPLTAILFYQNIQTSILDVTSHHLHVHHGHHIVIIQMLTMGLYLSVVFVGGEDQKTGTDKGFWKGGPGNS